MQTKKAPHGNRGLEIRTDRLPLPVEMLEVESVLHDKATQCDSSPVLSTRTCL